MTLITTWGGSMKHLIVLATLSLMSFGGWANSGASCELRITDNTVKCPIIGFCPEKVLRESKMTITEALSSGEVVSNKIVLNKVLLDPGTKNQEKHNIYQFPGDDRLAKLKEEEKDLDLVEYTSKTEIGYSMTSVGDTVSIEIWNNGSTYKARLTGSGNVSYSWLIVLSTTDSKNKPSRTPMFIKCSKTNELAINESELQKEALDKFLEEKKKKEELESQANQQ
jgi:hypothetical protein